MQIGSVEFRAGLWPTIVTAVVFPFLLSLGFWQLDRAAQKIALLDEYRAGSHDTVIQLEPDLRAFDSLNYQFASAVGHFDDRHQFLLDNRTHDGFAGYEVHTPLLFRDAKVAVLVNRGWLPIVGNRDDFPNLDVGDRLRTVVGKIKLPSQPFMLGDDEKPTGWPMRIQSVKLEKLAAQLGYELLPVVLLLDANQDDGFTREWHPLTFGPEKNKGYAVQWFGLALTLLIIYIAVNTRKVKRD